MYKKSIAAKELFDPSTAESMSDVLYEMGKDTLLKGKHSLAVQWLDRAHEILGTQEVDRLSMDASELRMSIMESWIKALLGVNDAAAIEKARNMVDLLDNEFPDRLVVLLLKLELLSSPTNEVFESVSYSEILHRMTCTMQFNNSNFKLIMYHIRKLKDKSPSLACKALDSFIRIRILKVENNEEWVEKAVVTRLWMIVGDIPESLDSLESILSAIFTELRKPVSLTVIQASHTVR
jgi:hypothetical protein